MSSIRRKSWKIVSFYLAAVTIGLSLLVSGCGQSATTSAMSAQTKLAAQRGYILVGLPTPVTGPLASFGEGMQWVAQRALAQINKNGGIYIKSLGKKLPVKVKIMDTESSDTTAATVTTQLITQDKVDMLLVLWTPDVVNPVCSIAERYHVPTIALNNPLEAWQTGGPYHWCYLEALTASSACDAYLGAWSGIAAKTDKVVGLLFPNDADGISWAKVFKQKLPEEGYKVVDPGRFPDSTNDFTALINQFKSEHVDIITGTLVPPVFATIWRQMHEQGFVPKVASIGKAPLFASDVAALGDNLAYGLTTEAWWSSSSPFKSSLDGETATDLSDAWTKATGKQTPETIGSDYAGFELMANALTRAQSLDPNKLVSAIGQTNITTMIGPVKFNDQHYAVMPLLLGQWVKGTQWPWKLQIVNDQQFPQVPDTAKMIFPLPKS